MARDLGPRLEAQGFNVGDRMRPTPMPSASEMRMWRTTYHRPPEDHGHRRYAEQAYEARRQLVRHSIGRVLAVR